VDITSNTFYKCTAAFRTNCIKQSDMSRDDSNISGMHRSSFRPLATVRHRIWADLKRNGIQIRKYRKSVTSTVWKYDNCGCRTLTCTVGFPDFHGDLSSNASWNLNPLLLLQNAPRFKIYCPRNCYPCFRELQSLFIILPVRCKKEYKEHSYSSCVA
jgi:hypothetical protein